MNVDDLVQEIQDAAMGAEKEPDRVGKMRVYMKSTSYNLLKEAAWVEVGRDEAGPYVVILDRKPSGR